MIGSIIGDIVGSIYEFHNIKTKDFPLFTERTKWTDDTILTIATAKWILEGGSASDSGRYYFRYGFNYPHPMGGYGDGFQRWLWAAENNDFEPYSSCGNGSAMRVGPVGWAFDTEDEVLRMAKASAECTHNHPEGIKGAQATALCIYLSRKGETKDKIKSKVTEKFGYDLNFTCDGIRETYKWGATCQDTVPQAIVAFLDGTDFEDCIRNAISIGGDSDTIGCITGSIAEAYYGVPEDIYNEAYSRLSPHFKNVVKEFEDKYGRKLSNNKIQAMEQIDIFTIETHGSKVMLTHCPTDTVGDVTIPDCVTDISISAFRGCTGITSVTIHDGVKSIGESAFNGCTSLENVTLGNGIKALGTSAFKDCTSLREVVIPDGITNIGGHAFDGCFSLTNVQFTENLKVIGHSAFKGCISLSEIHLPSGIMSIGRYAFHGCTGLRTANIPDGIKTVGGSSFNGCPVLTIESNVFPVIDGVIYTPDMTKAISCTNSEVKNIVIPPSVKDIERGAFRGCVKMELIVIPNGVETIGTSAFQDCKTLKEVVIPESVTKIDDSAFYACISLESVVFPKDLTNVGRWVFDGCLSLKESPIPKPVVVEIIPQDYTPVVSSGTLDIEAIIGTQIPDIAPVYGGVRGRTMSSRHQAYAWPTIAKAGIKTVIELRDGDSSEKLRQLCEQFGMEYFHYPVDNRGGCVESMVELLPRLCEYIDKGNFYIACAMGLHRTDIALCTYWVFYGADRGVTPPPIRGYRRDQGHDTNKIMRVLNAIYIRMTELNGAAPMSEDVFKMRKSIINEMSKI